MSPSKTEEKEIYDAIESLSDKLDETDDGAEFVELLFERKEQIRRLFKDSTTDEDPPSSDDQVKSGES